MTAALTNPLARVAVMARVSIGEWRPECDDRDEAARLADKNGADRRAVRVRKARVLHPLVKEITAHVQAWRQYTYAVTLPYLDRGTRVLPLALIAKYQEQERTARLKFEELTRELYERWDIIIAGMPEILGGLYDRSEYPTAAEVRAAYTWSVRILPLPEAPIHAHLYTPAVLADIERSIEQDAREGVTLALRDVYARLADCIGRMAANLAAESTRWHATTVTNVADLLDIAGALNLTNDPTLAALIGAAKQTLGGLNVDRLKSDDRQRKAAATVAEQLAQAAQAGAAGAADPLAKLRGIMPGI